MRLPVGDEPDDAIEDLVQPDLVVDCDPDGDDRAVPDGERYRTGSAQYLTEQP